MIPEALQDILQRIQGIFHRHHGVRGGLGIQGLTDALGGRGKQIGHPSTKPVNGLANLIAISLLDSLTELNQHGVGLSQELTENLF